MSHDTRRSFLASLLSSIAGGLVAGSLLFSRRAEAEPEACGEAEELAKKYGGPVYKPKYGVPTIKYGGPPKPPPGPARKYGGPPVAKYGGPATKYGGPPPGPAKKYGGPPSTKYGGPKKP
jgi:hypothetical protein